MVILTKIRSIELSYGINDVIIQPRFFKVQSYTSFTCEKKKPTEGDISINIRFLLRNNSYDHKKCSTQLLNLVTCYHFFYLGFKIYTCYQCNMSTSALNSPSCVYTKDCGYDWIAVVYIDPSHLLLFSSFVNNIDYTWRFHHCFTLVEYISHVLVHVELRLTYGI